MNAQGQTQACIIIRIAAEWRKKINECTRAQTQACSELKCLHRIAATNKIYFGTLCSYGHKH